MNQRGLKVLEESDPNEIIAVRRVVLLEGPRFWVEATLASSTCRGLENGMLKWNPTGIYWASEEERVEVEPTKLSGKGG